MRRKLWVSLAVVAACAVPIGALAPAQTSDAAVAPAQQWITAVTASPAAPATITWGTSGLTATLGTPVGAGSCDSTNVATPAQLVRFNAARYYSPTPPSSASGVQACISGLNSAVTRTVTLSKPVLAPIFHINNLDGSELQFLPGSSGGAIVLDRISSNVQSQLVGGNILRPVSVAGSNGCLFPDPATPNSATNNSTCGSYRMTEDGGALETFTLRNVSRISGADGFFWSISFPTSTVTKAFSPTTIRQGETASATFSMSNPLEEGAVPLTGLSFADALPTGMTLADGTLVDNGQCGTPALNGGAAAAGDATATVTAVDLAVGATCTVTVNVTTSTVGSFTNAASNITAGFANLIPSGTTTLTVLAPATPALTIVKSQVLTDTNNNGAADIGEQVAYSFAVENTGNVDLVDVAVDDPTLAALGVAITPASAALAVGGSTTFTSAAYTVTQADIDAGGLSNTATAEGVYAQSNGTRVPVASLPSSVTVPTPAQSPSVGLAKTAVLADTDGDGLADVGEKITYGLIVTNTGNVTLTGVTLSDAMLGAATPGPIATLSPGASVPFSVDHVVRDIDIVASQVVNEASASGAPPTGAAVTATDTATVAADTPAPSLITLKAPLLADANANGRADVGETVTYSFTVTNTGNVGLVDVSVADPALSALGIAITPGPTAIAIGASQTFTSAAYTVTQADIDAGGLSNTASAAGAYVQSDGNRVPVASGPSTATVPTAARAPSVALAKTGVLTDGDGDGRADPGETVTFGFVITNTGNVTLAGVTLSDPMLGTATPAPVSTLAPGAVVQFSVPHQVRDSDIGNGALVNTATVSATSPGLTTVTGTDTVTLGAQVPPTPTPTPTPTAPATPASLALTGASLSWAVVAAGLLLLVAGTALIRRRRAP